MILKGGKIERRIGIFLRMILTRKEDPLCLSPFSLPVPFLLSFSLFACWNNTFRDRFGSSVKSRTFRDVVTKLRALQLQTPNSPYDPALFRKPQSLYSWDDRATRFCGTSAPTEHSTPKLHFLRCGQAFP